MYATDPYAQTGLPAWHGTTILTVRKAGKVVIGGDGQVSIGQTVIKANARKVRKLGKGDVIGGFAVGGCWLAACIAAMETVRRRHGRRMRELQTVLDEPEGLDEPESE